MRFLNKIIFINSASIKYSEINLDGNVHFIGTQGVGKSALLRAILFFYNTDKLKLGIAKEKKTFDEYYFPYQNSYIVYEVMKESGAFSVLAFKSQGRVAFRFFDSAFDKKFFIDSEGRAFESWDKTREAFGKHIYYTKIIHSYEDYRNILYGNNKGLATEFRKYAILESKQFQNIPRTIQNVFLNSKLDAEFIKETIIKSLNEDEIKIDLTTYSHNHLRDFETNLNDIKKWTDKNKSGENPVQKQADTVSTFYSALKHLEKKKAELAGQLGWALSNVEQQHPKFSKNLKQEEQKRDKVKQKVADIDSAFEKKKEKIQEQIGKYKSKLDEIKTKHEDYASLKIETIIERILSKTSLELEKKNLLGEKEILTYKFLEIGQRYEALLKQLENQLKEFENNKHREENTGRANFLHFKEELNKQYDLLFEEIKKQNKEELEVARNIFEEKKTIINNLKIKKSDVKNNRFYETDIDRCNSEIINLKSAVSKSENEIRQSGERIKNIQKEWELEEIRIKEGVLRKIERQNEIQTELTENISTIDTKIENNKDSFYGWLNEQNPGWDKTIGKVIDEENVLFKSGLNPEKNSNSDLSFYGIRIDLNEISKTVKTIGDYEKEKEEFIEQIQSIQQIVSDLNNQLCEELEKLKKRFQPRVRDLKENIHKNEYTLNQSNLRLDETNVRLTEFKNKAESEKKIALEKIDDEIAKTSEQEVKAKVEISKIEGNINKLIDAKKKEKENKVKTEQEKVNGAANKIALEIKDKKIELAKRETEIKTKEKRELDNEGADTKRIGEIENRISEIDSELIFIDNNRDKVAEYNKDKRELFDKTDEFKSKKSLFEKQLGTELSKHKQQKEMLFDEIGIRNVEIEAINKILQIFEDDLKAFESFKLAEGYKTIEIIINEFTDESKTEKQCTQLIDELNKTHYNSIERFIDLQEAINKFTGNFQENNIFSFKTKFNERVEYFEFSELLKEFVEEDKISEYQKRVNERFAHIIRQIGKETGELISKEGEIHGVISDINKDFIARNFVGAIKSMELRTVESSNKIVQLLILIKNFNDENHIELGKPNLFTSGDQPAKNERAITLLKQLIKEMSTYKEKEITLSDSFELQFRIVENENDTDWVEKLSSVGSDGTDVLVKAMINIMLLNVFKDRAAKKNKDDFRLHCMMDEIGKLHPTNVKGILKFANDRNILLINSSPTTYNATDYRYTFLLSKDSKNITTVKRLVRKIPRLETEIALDPE